MNQTEILTEHALAYLTQVWWRNHAADLERRRQYSLSSGEGVLCVSLESAHHLAVRRAQQSYADWQRINGY